MAYTKFHSDWKNFPDTSTPLEADALDHIEAGIAAAIASPASIASGEAAVWDGSGWARSSVTKLGLGSIAQGGATTGQALVWNGSTWAPAAGGISVLDRVSTDATFASSTAENTLYTKSVAGGTLPATGFLRLTMWGILSTNAGTDTDRIRVKFGGTTHIDTGAFAIHGGGAITNKVWYMQTVIQADNATNAQTIEWFMAMAKGTGLTTGSGSQPESGANISIGSGKTTATIDTTSSQNFDITWQHGTNNANCSVTLHSAVLELL